MKNRGDSKLGTLPAERQAAVVEHALTHTLTETVAWLADQGIHLSRHAVGRFLAHYQLTRQLEQNAATVETLVETLAKHERTISSERLQFLGQLFFAELALEKRDPRLWYLAQQIELRKERLQLDWQKYRDQVQARKTDSKTPSGGITPETLDRIEREIKLM